MPLFDEALYEEATRAIAAVHRRPVSLRRSEVTSSEGVLRGAHLSALIGAWPAETAIAVATLLAPDAVETSARIFLRAPLQILARMDVLAGGDGKPEANVAALQQLARVISAGAPFLPGIVHSVIMSEQCFGARSGIIARAADRLAAVATGFDPRGLTVPEVYLHRHASEYHSLSGSEFLNFLLRAYIAGAREAESIARLATSQRPVSPDS